MKRLLGKRWFKLTAVSVICLLFVMLITAWYFRIWTWHDFKVYHAMSSGCHPVWRDLHWGRISEGQDVEEVIKATKPISVNRYGDFVVLSYQRGLCFTGVTITAKKGRLTHAVAGSCTWDRTFFDQMTDADWDAYQEAYEKHWRPIRRRHDVLAVVRVIGECAALSTNGCPTFIDLSDRPISP